MIFNFSNQSRVQQSPGRVPPERDVQQIQRCRLLPAHCQYYAGRRGVQLLAVHARGHGLINCRLLPAHCQYYAGRREEFN
jgi:hypothetical protein